MGRRRYECRCHRKSTINNVTGYSNGDVVCDFCDGVIYTKNPSLGPCNELDEDLETTNYRRIEMSAVQKKRRKL